MGHPRLTEYGLAPINSGPCFSDAAAPGNVGASRWLAPEIINPLRKGSSLPVTESKAADVFAFAMFAVEVYTGKVPFEEEPPAMAPWRILKGERPEIPEDAERMGLTKEIRELLERCWHQNPKKRPAMKEVVRKWRRFVDNEDAGAANDTRNFWIPVPAFLDKVRRTPPTTGPSRPQSEGSEQVPSESFLLGGYRSEVLIHPYRGSEKREKMVFRTVLISLSWVLLYSPPSLYRYVLWGTNHTPRKGFFELKSLFSKPALSM